MIETALPTAGQDTLDFELAAAQAALARGEQERALRIWAGLRERCPEHPAAYRHAAEALAAAGKLDEAEAVLRAGRGRVQSDALLLATEYARVATRRHDMAEAARRWEAVRLEFPNDAVGYVGNVESLREGGQLDEAEALFEALVARFPNERAAPILRASLADARQNWADSVELWAVVREQLPQHPVGWIKGAKALQQAASLDEAEALLAEAVERHADNTELAFQYAELAAQRRQWEEAAARWARVRERQPGIAQAYINGATALREAGRLDEAEALLTQAAERFPDRPGLAREKAQNAEAQLGLARTMLAQDRLDEAETLLCAAMERFPQHHGLFLEYAKIASRRHAWEEALRRWRDAQRRFPQIPEIRHRVFEAELRVVEAEPEELAAPVVAVPPSPPPPSVAPPPPAAQPDVVATPDNKLAMREVVTQFESLGGTLQGCEFGLLQRAFGAEPLGLLRWTEMAPKNVIDALEAELEGVGLPENTELGVHQTPDGPEYFTTDKRFLMSMHTFMRETEISHDKMYALCCRRLQFLREKLLADLRDGTKIFVYKITWRLLQPEELDRMHAALRRYGNNTLLYVQRALPDKPHGTVELIKPGLLMGYIDRFSVSATGENLGQATESWAPICRRALELWDGGGTSSDVVAERRPPPAE